MSEYSDEVEIWELAEKIFVQTHSTRLTKLVSQIAKDSYESAKEFHQLKTSALDKKLSEKESSKSTTKG